MNKITAPELYERENNSKTSCKGASVGLFSEPIYRLKFLQKSDITYRLIWSFLIRKISTVLMKTNSRFFFLKSSFNLTSIWKKKWEKEKYQIKRFGRSWTNKTKLIRWKFLIFNWSGPEGGIGIFGFGYFLDRFFGFSVLVFTAVCRFSVS